MIQIDYYAIFLIGLVSSFGHCIGMCGGFVMAYSLKINENHPGVGALSVSPHLLYNIGRILTYAVLGLFFGLVGEQLGSVMGLRNFQGTVEIIAGIVMIWLGLDFGGWIPPMSANFFPGYNHFKKAVGFLLNRVNRRNVFGLGLMLGFIPCGLVYAAGAKAAATESMIGGMLTMLAFGLGTIPAMMTVGVGANVITAQFRQRLLKAATILVIILGVLTIMRGVKAFTQISPPHTQASESPCCL